MNYALTCVTSDGTAPLTVHAPTRARTVNVRTLYDALTQTATWLLLATQGVDHLIILHDARKHTPSVQMADRLVLPTNLYPVAPGDAPERPDQLQLLANIVQH
jgi:hypothetical protein